jgi:hypothetical protein
MIPTSPTRIPPVAEDPMIQFQPLVVETPDFPSQLMIDTHLPVLCSGGFPPSGAFEKFENAACRQAGRWLAATPVSIVGFSQRPALTVMPAATVSSIPQSSAHQLLSSVFMTACNIRPDGSHIHGARYVDRWTAIVANAFRFDCYRRVRPFFDRGRAMSYYST